jgi:histidyl-tRNA synthetase
MSNGKIKAIYGTRDILPEEADRWRRIVSTVSRISASYNYDFIMPPIFEATELFARGIGEISDIVTREMYTFKDQGGRSLTLRPEGTASVVRAYLEHSLGATHGLVKVWYAGPMFRQERPQAGRYRQFYQFGVEAIGSLDPVLDAEVINLNYDILKDLGMDDLTLEINSIGMPEDRKAHREAFSRFVEPNLKRYCQDCQRRFGSNPLRMFDCKEDSCQSLLSGAPVVFDYLLEENRQHFDEVLKYLRVADLPFTLNKRLVRGLDYYTRTAWEFKSAKLGSQDAVAGGGRYDLLVEQLGGSPTPGIGFAAGVERILMAMPSTAKASDRWEFGFFIAIRDRKFKAEAFKLLNVIRSFGLPADIDYLGRSLKAQMKQAGKSGLSYALILAESEAAAGKVVVRNMQNSKQFELALIDIYNAGDAGEIGDLIAAGQR